MTRPGSAGWEARFAGDAYGSATSRTHTCRGTLAWRNLSRVDHIARGRTHELSSSVAATELHRPAQSRRTGVRLNAADSRGSR
jgi:hypothetical protein